VSVEQTRYSDPPALTVLESRPLAGERRPSHGAIVSALPCARAAVRSSRHGGRRWGRRTSLPSPLSLVRPRVDWRLVAGWARRSPWPWTAAVAVAVAGLPWPRAACRGRERPAVAQEAALARCDRRLHGVRCRRSSLACIEQGPLSGSAPSCSRAWARPRAPAPTHRHRPTGASHESPHLKRISKLTAESRPRAFGDAL